MRPPQRVQAPEGSAPWNRWMPASMGVLALLPYALYHGMFSRLFWFGDEFDQLDQMDRLGLWRWTWQAFAENFVPVFKALWAGAVLASGGSYAAMILIVWLTHALNVALLGRLMRTCGLPWAAVLAAQLVLGLAPINFETLAWSIQWSAEISVCFMLLALGGFFRATAGFWPVAWAAASALSFARGVLTGLVLAAAALWPGAGPVRDGVSRRVACAAAYALPAILVGLLITILYPSGNDRHMAGHWGEAAQFGAWCYALNPAYRLFGIGSWGLRTVILLGALKLALVAWSLARSRGRARTLFAVLTLFDLGNAALLGIGRYHTGLSLSVSSRYQYAALIGILPLAGFWFARQWDRIPTSQGPRRILLAAVLALAAIGMCRLWRVELDPFTAGRGTDARRAVAGGPGMGEAMVPGLPSMPMERARALVAKYHLH